MELEKNFEDEKDDFLTMLDRAMKAEGPGSIQLTFKRGSLIRCSS